MTATLTATIGLPGSGKSTWAREHIVATLAAGGRVARVNRDALRDQIHPAAYSGQPTEKAVTLAAHASIAALLATGWSVVCDDTNLRARNLRALRDIATEAGAAFEIRDFTDVPLEECIRRDALRPAGDGLRDGRAVGEAVIRELHQKFLHGGRKPQLGPDAPASRRYEPKPGTPTAVMVDVDGTLALMQGRSPYDETLVHQDLPNEPVIRAVREAKAAGHVVVVMSGRSENSRAATAEWLWRQDVPCDALHMRPAGDTRQDAVVKLELFDANVRDLYNVVRVYDDRQQVVDAWRKVMPDRVFQVAPGRF